jgi:ABC-type multidrug transport system ATPase subunit
VTFIDDGAARRHGRNALIQAIDVHRSFGQTPALQGASLSAAPGEILAVMGPSGSGKSTISLLTIRHMAPAGTPMPLLGHVYYLTVGAGFVVSLLVILATLPLLSRIAGMENVRFE